MDLEEIKKAYFEENDMVEKEYVDDKKNKQLNKKYEEEGNLLEDTFEGYYYESSEEGYDFYQKKYPDFTNTELEQITNIQNNRNIKKCTKDIHSMKNILVFWFILTIINLIILFITLSKPM